MDFASTKLFPDIGYWAYIDVCQASMLLNWTPLCLPLQCIVEIGRWKILQAVLIFYFVLLDEKVVGVCTKQKQLGKLDWTGHWASFNVSWNIIYSYIFYHKKEMLLRVAISLTWTSVCLAQQQYETNINLNENRFSAFPPYFIGSCNLALDDAIIVFVLMIC